MEPVLLSDLREAENHSSIIKDGFHSLSILKDAAQGETNDGANHTCMEIYASMQECLSSYLAAADRDAGRIREIGLHFADVDSGLSDGM